MPPALETKTTTKTKLKGKGLGKRLGPFPLWLWLGAGAGLLLVGYLYLRGRGGGGDSGYGVETVSGSGASAASPYEQAGAGAPSQNGAPGAGLTPDVLDAITSAVSSGASRYDIQDELLDRFAQFETRAESATGGVGDPWLPPYTSDQAVLDATLGPPATALKAKPQTRPTPKSRVTGVRKTKTGGIITTYRGGRKVQQEPGKKPYVIAKGKGPPSGVKPARRSQPKTAAPKKKPVVKRPVAKRAQPRPARRGGR